MSNILLTGSSGFLGSNLLESLMLGNKILTFGRKKGNYICDLSNSTFKLNEPVEFVIHSAGKAHVVPSSVNEINAFYQINVEGTKNLLKSLEDSFVPKYFIFISSVSVYGIRFGNNIKENAPLLATDPYGESKILAEKITEEWCNKNNVVYTCLRLPLLVAKNPPGNLGAMIKAIKYKYYFNIDGGRAKRSMLLISDLAKFILIAGRIGGIYNLTDGYHPSYLELSRKIAISEKRVFIPSISIYVINFISLISNFLFSNFPLSKTKIEKLTSTLTFDDSKARETFGWSPSSVLNSDFH
jgi:nucleoside-diphosphate-sugar epimerase